jgi:hypothetical protein
LYRYAAADGYHHFFNALFEQWTVLPLVGLSLPGGVRLVYIPYVVS